jgi:hypothetical protein
MENTRDHCPRCGSLYAIHEGDGSCVVDNAETIMPRALPTVRLRGREWFVDCRLSELRATDEPWTSLSMDEDMTGEELRRAIDSVPIGHLKEAFS